MSVWSRMREKHEPAIIARRLARRISTFQDAYSRYLATLPTRQSITCPTYHYFRIIPEVALLLEADSSTTVTSETFNSLFPAVLSCLPQYLADRKREILATIPSDSSDSISSEESLNLARHVFICDQDRPMSWRPNACPRCGFRCFVGWDMLSSHGCIGHGLLQIRPGVTTIGPTPVVYDEKLSMASSTMIRSSGLDPATATLNDMDNTDARFTCWCTAFIRGVRVHTWRSMVSGLCFLLSLHMS